MKPGLLVINLGTPRNCTHSAVKSYLREFLTDRRVIDLPWPLRYLLVYGLIVPFRTKKSAHAYQSIWTKQGSPLLHYSQNLVAQLETVAEHYTVALGMRYNEPSIQSALDKLHHCESITILPLYPQYSSAATGSALEEVFRILSREEVIPSLKIIRDFYKHPAYIRVQAQFIKDRLDPKHHLLFSYHGIPERQILKTGCKTVCQKACPLPLNTNQACYKAQCHHTSTLLAAELQLKSQEYSTAFQSRLGKTPWIKPYTDELLIELVGKGVKNLTICCPSFVTDCLETIEEIGMRAKEQWISLGGQQFTLIPSMNDDRQWAKAILELI